LLFVDVPGWRVWNDGIEHIQRHGPFATGTPFTMQPSGTDAFVSTLIDVAENAGFTDETVIDGTRVIVEHRIEPMALGGTRVTYATPITDPGAQEFGPMVTADFRDVLHGLKKIAKQS
jgi:hypothetical protein